MDVPSWDALRRVEKDRSRYGVPTRGPDGCYQPVEQIMPMNEAFPGGFKPLKPDKFGPPPAPPRDYVQKYVQSQDTNGHSKQHPVPPQISAKASASSSRLTHRSAVERSQALRMARMEPHLQLMVGPLLRYDTVDEGGVWHGFALVVSSDAGSNYEPLPVLTYRWDPDGLVRSPLPMHNANLFELGPHPSDPYSTGLPSTEELSRFLGPNAQHKTAPSEEIWVYEGNGGTHTFWRFKIEIPLGQHQMAVKYSINSGQELEFYVPGRAQNMRWATYSCNGFSAGVNPDDFRGPGFRSGYDPLWTDLLFKHAEQPFHALVGGGDQLYCDSLMREPEMQEWVHRMKPEQKRVQVLTEEMASAIDRFFFNHYCVSFRSGAFARANSSIPMMNMCDDHDLIDGFGSYPDDLQLSPVFRTIGQRGYFFYLLFQCFINVEVDGLNDKPGEHSNRSLILGAPGPYISSPSHSFLAYLGPQIRILLLDCRAERRKNQICSHQEYQNVFERLRMLPQGVEHLVVQLGIPIAYPRMVFLEAALESKFNPLLILSRAGAMGLGGFVNRFNEEAELLDDLNDHWTAKAHKKERNWFIEQLQLFAKTKCIRVTFLSGDVHCAAVGVLKTLAKPKNAEVPPPVDYRYMINVVTSAIVNTPPPNGVILMVSGLATKTHKTMHYCQTDETMVPVFSTETNGAIRKQKIIMGQRNWCSVNWDPPTGDLLFDIRVEKEKGIGKTVGYAVRTPPPRWNSQ